MNCKNCNWWIASICHCKVVEKWWVNRKQKGGCILTPILHISHTLLTSTLVADLKCKRTKSPSGCFCYYSVRMAFEQGLIFHMPSTKLAEKIVLCLVVGSKGTRRRWSQQALLWHIIPSPSQQIFLWYPNYFQRFPHNQPPQFSLLLAHVYPASCLPSFMSPVYFFNLLLLMLSS